MFKKRTKVGKFLDTYGTSQEWLAAKTKLNRTTISKICSDSSYSPKLATIKKIVTALKTLKSDIKADDFFDI